MHYDNNTIGKEINKIKSRIPNWKKKPEQINHKILQAFFDLEKSGGQITEYLLEKHCRDKYDFKFYGNFSQMINFGVKNHGKVFERNTNGSISLWQPVEDFVRQVWGENIKTIG